MDLKEKSLITLELPAILDLLAGEAVSAPAKESCLALRPSENPAEVRRHLAETSAAKQMMVIKGSPSFSGVKDVRPSLARAEMGGMLNTRELLDIAAVLTSARLAYSYGISDKGGRSEIDFLFSSLRANKYLEEKICSCIIAEDEIADAASAELSDIRRLIRAAGARVKEALQKIISSPSYSKALQEPIITTRFDRYVVPIKQEYKSSVPGLVHDVSSSGATLFIEPMAAVNANNELRELRVREKHEIDRIMMELSADVAGSRESLERDFSILVALDIIFAKAKLSFRQNAGEAQISERAINLKKARHPLLAPGDVVPIDITLGNEFDTLVITGPNTGGKTVTLKTLGLLSAMNQCGLHIPAGDSSTLPVFEMILADIGDEQSIEQSLSTFSSHMFNIVRILEGCTPNSLLLFDELGAGTDPVEGAALAIAIIEEARNKGASIAATTHYSELKIYATSTPGVQNASCEFDVETLRPTYRLIIGVPGKSNAFAIAERLGLNPDIIVAARQHISAENASLEETLTLLEEKRQHLEKLSLEAEKSLREAKESEKKARQMERELTVRLDKSEERAKREAARIIADARDTAESVISELDEIRKAHIEAENIQAQNEMRSLIRRQLNAAEEKLMTGGGEIPKPKPSSRPVVPGDTVQIISVGTKAEVIERNPNGTLLLQAGLLKVTAREDEILLLENETVENVKRVTNEISRTLNTREAKPELDIRGMTADEAIYMAERFIDNSAMSNLKTVTIIHGKGTGVLRNAVSQILKTNPLVDSFRLGRYGEGETGVTVVELR